MDIKNASYDVLIEMKNSEEKAERRAATQEMERRAHDRRQQQAIEWAEKNLDNILHVSADCRIEDEKTVALGGGLARLVRQRITHMYYRGRLRDLLDAGHSVLSPLVTGHWYISASDVPDHTGDKSRVELVEGYSEVVKV